MKIRPCTSETVITTQVSGMFPNGRYRHGLGWIEKGDDGRRVQGGPMVPGPWAFAFGLSTSITSDPRSGTGYEAKTGREAGTEFPVRDGDLLLIDGSVYEVETFRHEEYVNLHLLDIVGTRSEADRRSRLYEYQLAIEDKRAAAGLERLDK